MSGQDDRLHREQVSFLERHKDADILVCDTRTKQCTEAIYYSPMKKDQEKREQWVEPPKGISTKEGAEANEQWLRDKGKIIT